MPGEALLIERDDHLGTFDVGLLGWDEVGLIGVLPVNFDSEYRINGEETTWQRETDDRKRSRERGGTKKNIVRQWALHWLFPPIIKSN